IPRTDFIEGECWEAACGDVPCIRVPSSVDCSEVPVVMGVGCAGNEQLHRRSRDQLVFCREEFPADRVTGRLSGRERYGDCKMSGHNCIISRKRFSVSPVWRVCKTRHDTQRYPKQKTAQ